MSTGFPASYLFLPSPQAPIFRHSDNRPEYIPLRSCRIVGKFLSPERREVRSLRYADKKSEREINGKDGARAGLAQDLDVSPVRAYYGPNEA